MILIGHVLDRLRELPEKSVHCCVTSPPYWSLRDYEIEPIVWGGDQACSHVWKSCGRQKKGGPGGEKILSQGGKKARSAQDSVKKARLGDTCSKCGAWRGQLGLEPTPELYVEHIVEVFREVRRVLRDDGTIWVNLGDSYASGGHGGGGSYRNERPAWMAKQQELGWRAPPPGLKAKDLVGIPWMIAFALRADGWHLRSDNIWHKPTAMPSSVNDRPTTDHEYVFLLSKKRRYFYDSVAVRVETSGTAKPRGNGQYRKLRAPQGWNTGPGDHKELRGRYTPKQNGAYQAAITELVTHRNLRTVWRITSTPFPGAHFATFPPRLVEPCIKAGTSEHGVCPECGAPWRRLTQKRRVPTRPGTNTKCTPKKNGDQATAATMGWGKPLTQGNRDPQRHVSTVETIGWEPGCSCDAGEPVPATVLDPFLGSGTTALMAEYLKRRWVGIELKEEYAGMAESRIAAGYKPPKQSRCRKARRAIERLQKLLFQ